MSLKEKKQRIQPKHPKISMQRQCKLIKLPRSSYYREGLAEQETPENLDSMRRQGYKINRKRVQRLIRKMEIQSIAPKPKTSKANPQNKVIHIFWRILM